MSVIMHRHQTTTTRQAFFCQQIHYLLADVHNLNIPDSEKDEIHDLPRSVAVLRLYREAVRGW